MACFFPFPHNFFLKLKRTSFKFLISWKLSFIGLFRLCLFFPFFQLEMLIDSLWWNLIRLFPFLPLTFFAFANVEWVHHRLVRGFCCKNCMNNFPLTFCGFGSCFINASPAWRFPSIYILIPCSRESASLTSFSIKSQNFSLFSFVAFSWTPYPTITLIWISPTTT